MVESNKMKLSFSNLDRIYVVFIFIITTIIIIIIIIIILQLMSKCNKNSYAKATLEYLIYHVKNV